MNIDVKNVSSSINLGSQGPKGKVQSVHSHNFRSENTQSFHKVTSSSSNDNAMFLITPDGVIHTRDVSGKYIPEITLQSYKMAGNALSSEKNSIAIVA
jgi:hypothetical protein